MNYQERIALNHQVTYVHLNQNGKIGIISTSAGNCMATIDRVAYFGASAGNFCDLGGTPYTKLAIEALALMEKEANI